ncbi:MAG: HK97 gp10 family phage protein [Candidatus Bathyarchaeia archaeon]
MSLKVEVNTSKFEKWKETVNKTLAEEIDKIILDSAQIVAERMGMLAPVRTGQLKASITLQRESDKVLIGPTAPYAPYIILGIRPSPGRYVPAIERRLVNPQHPSFGMHPGIAPNPFVERAWLEAGGGMFAKVDEEIRRRIHDF